MEAAVEGDDRRAAGRGAGDLDRVLDRLGAGVQEQRAAGRRRGTARARRAGGRPRRTARRRATMKHWCRYWSTCAWIALDDRRAGRGRGSGSRCRRRSRGSGGRRRPRSTRRRPSRRRAEASRPRARRTAAGARAPTPPSTARERTPRRAYRGPPRLVDAPGRRWLHRAGVERAELGEETACPAGPSRGSTTQPSASTGAGAGTASGCRSRSRS